MNGRRQTWVAAGCIDTGCEAAMLDVDLEVVLEVPPDAGHVGDDGDAHGLELGGRPDPVQQQELRRVDGATGEDHLTGVDRLGAAAVPLDLHARRARAVEVHPVTIVEVRSVRLRRERHDRVEVGPRGRQPSAPVDVPVERREALLAIAVDVVRPRVAGLDGGRRRRP